MAPDREPWFGPKRFGFGVGPRTWQGALVILAVIAGLALVRHFVSLH